MKDLASTPLCSCGREGVQRVKIVLLEAFATVPGNPDALSGRRAQVLPKAGKGDGEEVGLGADWRV